MARSCYVCHATIGSLDPRKFSIKDLQSLGRDVPSGMGPNDRICGKCHVTDTAGRMGAQEAERELMKESSGHSSASSPMGMSVPAPVHTSNSNNSSIPSTLPTTSSVNLSENTSSVQLRQLTKTLHDQYKAQWDKNGVVQIKTPSLAILQRMWGQQVQFIVACDQLSKEGYRLMAIDEGKEGSSGGIAGGVNAYFYFQKMDFVR
jgi:hypothetical protein